MLGLPIQKIYIIPHSNIGDLADMDEKEKKNSHYSARARTAAVDGAVGPRRSGKGSGRRCGVGDDGATARGRLDGGSTRGRRERMMAAGSRARGMVRV
jgi:hypothetical protein